MAEEERKLSVEEIRRTIATSLAGAFAFVIALLWTQVVLGGLGAAGISTTSPKDWGAWGIFAVAAAVIHGRGPRRSFSDACAQCCVGRTESSTSPASWRE